MSGLCPGRRTDASESTIQSRAIPDYSSAPQGPATPSQQRALACPAHIELPQPQSQPRASTCSSRNHHRKASNPTSRFSAKHWLSRHVAAYWGHPLLVAGDFNSQNIAWDCTRTKPRGSHNVPEFETKPLAPATLSSWIKAAHDAYNKYTQTIPRDMGHPYVDSRLVNPWDKMVQNFRKNKTNRRLKKVIQNMTEEAQDNAQSLATENWLQICDHLNVQFHTPRVWQILRKLMEKMALHRLECHLDTTVALRYTMTGFIKPVCTQDTMMRIH
ncbi:hypothetical protein HPB47_000100 [Ixodes persulcatus]|uniref:Uncharacterized protein n=1 Tax=Ixodes persulcatus TaxID=34615 RepID=A0AC60PUG5_IXOPE|nr:hypothetical protein HPB47_000100 [Ixodes persulcatus]